MAHLSFLILTLRHWKNKVHINIPNCLLPGWNAWLNAVFSNHALLNPQPRQWHIPVASPNPSGFRNEQKGILGSSTPVELLLITPQLSALELWFSWFPRSPLSSSSGHSKAMQDPAWDIREGGPSQGQTQPPFLMPNTWPTMPAASHSYCAGIAKELELNKELQKGIAIFLA